MMSLKKKRIEFSQAEKDMLTSAWDAGMKSVSDHNEIKKISAQLNICEKRIEAWIGNKRAQARGYSHNYRKKAKALKYGPNAYSLFVGKQRRGNLPPSEFLKTAALNYRQLDFQEKKRLKEEAKAVRETKLMGMARKDIIDYHINVIAKSCEELSCLGYEIGGIGGDVENISKSSVFGTDKAINYFSSKVEDFEHVIATRGFHANTTTLSNRKQLRKKVQTKFQDLWYKASKKTSSIPYSKIKSGSIDLKVLGLPEGIEFKSPSDYSMKQLKQVLDANNVSFEIGFHIKEEWEDLVNHQFNL